MFVYLGIALFAGFLLANQNPINADLRKNVNSPFWASTISQIIGVVFLGTISLLLSGDLFPSAEFVQSHPAWIWIGGLLGPVYVTSNVFLFPRLGAVQTVILPILGQILTGVVIDSFGWFYAVQIPMSPIRVLGIIVTILGLFVAVVLPSLREKTRQVDAEPNLILWRLWAIISGAFTAVQQAINGHLGTLLHRPFQASFMSFFIGLIAIVSVTLVIERRLITKVELGKIKKWNILGGIWGAFFVLGAVLAVPKIGAGLNIMMALLGQIIGSMLVQQFGWWRSDRYPIRLIQVVGVAIMLLGIICIKFL
ncbi:DMT family transporter [Lactococcus formosensis]|uniref:DMT family transporter n=1 Tax=Lactococcus formosensis TaxID=1281486 RepID=A0A9X4PAF4_9LACT|nr:DMT family transporter [Lactococcus formosensis]MDG6110674.1 DMT family transporter [Lactococcus formosensis]MDG6117075.1 DMT family transporter [Lactococcus formosensis]MDG6125737.1 DMT family transporter [Lactococcus formosensis]MDG6132221.1 DMT family transporter [Lactococcus formosensis]MDG6134218.1 DMT family transporter [Lactococcus formosensis]